MPINVLNRFGPISFDAITNISSGSAINSLLSGIVSVGGGDFSISSSYTSLKRRVGNPDSDTSGEANLANSVGVGIINDDSKIPIKFSEFYGASYLSSSFNLHPSNGTCEVKIYSPSLIVNNNFLTNNGQDQVFKYTLYGKDTITLPIVDSGWTKLYSYSKAGDNIETFYNLFSSKAYKIVSKDCFSNAFTSSMFIGTCTNSDNYNSSYYYNVSANDLSLASSVLMNQVLTDASTNKYTQTQINDINTITKNLSTLINNPATFRTTNSPFPVISYKDIRGYNRNLTFDGLIFQKRQSQSGPLGGFYNGLVTATSVGGTIPTYQYSFENTSTFGQIYFYILNSQPSTGTGCDAIPTKPGNFPSIISFQGPRCGILDCGPGKPQPVCNPTQVTQVNHSGSFTITNNNSDTLSVSISEDWTYENGDDLPDLLTPVAVYPSNQITIPGNATRTLSAWFGVRSSNQTPAYSDPNQPVSFVAKTIATLTLPGSYTPNIQACEIKASFDKNSCIVIVPPPVVVPPTSNAGCVYDSNSSWSNLITSIKSKIQSGTGTTNDKTFATTIVSAIPTTGCSLPTSYGSTTLVWTLVPNGNQPYACSGAKFSGTYKVNASSTLGSYDFNIEFSRDTTKNYINLCQLGGISSPVEITTPGSFYSDFN